MVRQVDGNLMTADHGVSGTEPLRGACDGLSVVEFGQGMAGSMPGMVLADNGADVVKVEPPGGDWSRGEPGFLMWNRGKRSAVLDLRRAEDRDQAVGLARRADVVIESFRPGVAERLGIGWPVLQAANPRLVYCSISGFGPATSYAGVAGYEHLVSAAIGRMVGLDHLNGAAVGQDRQAPLFTSVPVASYGAAQLALQGILAALLRRERTGGGEWVTTSLVQGAAAFLMRQELPRGTADRPAPLVTEAMHAGIELCFMTALCQDGRYLQMCARQDLHFRNWLTALDLESQFDDPRFARAPMGIPRVEDVAELDGIIRGRMATRTQAEWMRVFTTEHDVGCDPFLTPSELLEHPQMVENGRVVELDDPTVGRCRQVGALVSFSETPCSIERPAPTLGQHTAEVIAELDDRRARSSGEPAGSAAPSKGQARSERPLEGITVVELAYYIAGPLAGALLAELGARVIKVEPLEGDPYRRTGLQSAKFLHGKESIALDLKAPAGQQILHDLIARADIFVHSFRPGVPERLRVDYPTLAAINPALTYLYAASYGSRGPQAGRTAFHSTPNALAGGGILQAGSGNPPVDDSFPDPGSALGVATAMLLGLHARQRIGRGQSLETTMLASTGYIMSPYTVSYDDAPPLRPADRGQHGFDALNRLYRCSDGWLLVCCPRDHQWRSLAEGLGGGAWLSDPRFSTAACRLGHDDDLVALIGDALSTDSAGQWARRLAERGAPAVVALEEPIETWFESQGLLIESEHPMFGQYWRPPPKVDFQTSTPRLGPAAAVGEHSRALLSEIGYVGEVADRLVSDGVVGVWPSEP